jgi:hypothetical protein
MDGGKRQKGPTPGLLLQKQSRTRPTERSSNHRLPIRQHGIPIERADPIALVEISRFLTNQKLPEKILMCTFSNADQGIYLEAL